MADFESKEKHSRRIFEKEVDLRKKIRQGKSIQGFRTVVDKSPHRYQKVSPFTCGNSSCVMCGNPRKFWGERTIQEKRFLQEV